MKQTTNVALLVVLVWIATTAPAAAQLADQVSPRRGTPASGQVVETSTTAVTIEVRGTRRKFPVNEIRRVTFAQDPQELRRARDNCLTGRYQTALLDLKKVNPASVKRPEVQQDLQFYTAYARGRQALSGGGDKLAAAKAMLDFVKQHFDSFHFFEAAELLGDLAVSTEDYDNAVRYYRAISTKSPWPDYKMKAGILEARALMAQEKYADAQSRLEAVTSQTVDTPEATRQKLLAEISKAVCLAETGSHDAAIATLYEIIDKNDPRDSELFGRAYNALGRCQLKAERQKEALLAYLHVDVLFYAEPDVHAEALYNLSKLWAKVNKSDRAVSARSLLTDRYSGSAWAKRN